MRLLLHACCGPCALYPLRVLLERGVQVHLLFFNPNIHPLQEYVRRWKALQQVAQALGVPVICSERYDPAVYFRQVAFREERRCKLCYILRLERTIHIARHGGFDAFSTTLLYSKFQKHEEIRQLAEDMRGSIPFYYEDFREGWSEGIARSKEMGIYRQQYCGCLYSEAERFKSMLGP
ncbi:hypothetical protein TDMWS_00710 [Thermodesulfomicrobium sp. WS]|uniref:epoxyqueuosine reductase QueH n=1 Tax=Thermodesulfomicrobium sp. WS TaxID=3004129 RepID=UPI00249302F3|nr:epoxyqueuosine reductase QueH [Thermodesulfomicrobium sp. WS]BDU99985.1 hypothetical protein TDMWS_00710 [Thermodesulfomicrobium sp. WS]